MLHFGKFREIFTLAEAYSSQNQDKYRLSDVSNGEFTSRLAISRDALLV